MKKYNNIIVIYSLGKKCTVKDDKIVYSYLWVYDKSKKDGYNL